MASSPLPLARDSPLVPVSSTLLVAVHVLVWSALACALIMVMVVIMLS